VVLNRRQRGGRTAIVTTVNRAIDAGSLASSDTRNCDRPAKTDENIMGWKWR